MIGLSYNVNELDVFRSETDLIDDVVKYHSEGSKCLLHGKSYSHFFDSNIGFDDYKLKIATAVEGICECGFYSDIQRLLHQEIDDVKVSINSLKLTKEPTIRIAKLITRNEIIFEFLSALNDQLIDIIESYKNLGSKGFKLPPGFNPILKPYFEDFESKKFIPGWRIENKIFDFDYSLYDEIPIIQSFSNVISNKIIVSAFNKAFKMRQKLDPSWYNNELNIEVLEVDDNIAERKLNENPRTWTTWKENFKLSNQEAITLIKNSVIINTWLTQDIQVTDKEAYEVLKF